MLILPGVLNFSVILQDPEGWTVLASCIADGLVSSDMEPTAGACAHLLEGVQRMARPDMQRNAVDFIVERITDFDAQCCTSSQEDDAAASECSTLLDTLESIATCQVDGATEPRVQIALYQALLRHGRPQKAFEVLQVGSSCSNWQLWAASFQSLALRMSTASTPHTAGSDTASPLSSDGVRDADSQASISGRDCVVAAMTALKCVGEDDVWRLWLPALSLLLCGDAETRDAGCHIVGVSVADYLRISRMQDLGPTVAAVYSAIWCVCHSRPGYILLYISRTLSWSAQNAVLAHSELK